MSTMEREQTRLVRSRMSWDEYLEIPEGVRAEYVDGEVIVTPPATMGHNKTQRRLANVIEAALDPALDVVTDSGWRCGTRARIPDVSVHLTRQGSEVVYTEETPLILAEVLSPSTRSEDTLRKSPEYAAAGVQQFWVVDREHRSLIVLVNNGSGWDTYLELDDDHPTGEVVVGEHGTVPLDLVALLAP